MKKIAITLRHSEHKSQKSLDSMRRVDVIWTEIGTVSLIIWVFDPRTILCATSKLVLWLTVQKRPTTTYFFTSIFITGENWESLWSSAIDNFASVYRWPFPTFELTFYSSFDCPSFAHLYTFQIFAYYSRTIAYFCILRFWWKSY